MTELSDKTRHDLQLLRLLIERDLMDRFSEEALGRGTTLAASAAPSNPDRQVVELSFRLQRGLQARVSTSWWNDSDRDVESLCESAGEFAESVERLWTTREDIGNWMGEMRAALRREVARGRRRGIPYRVVSVGIGDIGAGSLEFPNAAVSLERLSPSLVPETITLNFDNEEEVAEAFAGMREAQEARMLRRFVLQAAGADGEIDLVALRAMQSRGCDVPAVLASLPNAPGGILDVGFPHGDDRDMVLFWQDGVVRANFRLADKVHWRDGRVVFDELSKHFPVKPHGQLLSEFIQHDAIPEGLRIRGGYQTEKGGTAYVTVPTARFNSRTGEVLAA